MVQNEPSSHHDWLLRGEESRQEISRLLPALEVLARREDHRLKEGLGLLTTRFPKSVDGEAPFAR